jgi:N-acetylmuramoyl-L-alanine amidase
VNAAGADLFISIHNNGSTNRAEGGAEVWYDPTRAFAHDNYRLANAVLDGMLSELAGAGYAATNRGLKNAATSRVFNGRTFSLFVLGNARAEPRRTRATAMPGVLGESLFMSNPTEGALLSEPRIQQAIARGYLRGVNAYFGR